MELVSSCSLFVEKRVDEEECESIQLYESEEVVVDDLMDRL